MDAWHMSQMSLANATDIIGKCHGYRWQMPQTSLANAVNYLANAMDKKNNRSHTGESPRQAIIL
jgi:hypothetical protein